MKSNVSTRSLFVWLILGVLLVFCPSPASAQYVWHERNGHQYALTQNQGDWAEVEAEAQSQGGHLVTINDASENEWLANTFRDLGAVWIGYHSHTSGNPCTISWVWASDQVSVFSPPWSVVFPRIANQAVGTDAFLYVSPSIWAGKWRNYSHANLNGVIEREPPTYRLSLERPRVNIRLRAGEADDAFELSGLFRLSQESNGVFPATEEVALRVGSLSTHIPAGAFVTHRKAFHYHGLEGTARLKVTIVPTCTQGVYSFEVSVKRAGLESTTLNPAIQLVIGDDSGESILEFGRGQVSG